MRNILNFEKDFPEARVVMLEQNYRSTSRILQTATHVIQSNQQRKHKDLWTENEQGELTNVIETYTEHEEAQFVIKEIERLADAGEVRRGNCAVMYRTNAQSRVLEESFIRYGVPYKLVAGTRFYERREIKDILGYLRLIQNPYDSVSMMRVINTPGRGIGQHSLDELAKWARSQKISSFQALQRIASPEAGFEPPPFSTRIMKTLGGFGRLLNELITQSQVLNLVDFFDLVVKRSGYKDYILREEDGDERWDNVQELRTVAEEYRDLPPAEGLSAFLESVALVSDIDDLEEENDKVTLITLHQAKGLEFDVVFIVGVEEGLLPHFRSMDDPVQMEEERRLCYVGITRARRLIYLVRAFRRSLMGRSSVNKPSRFLLDIPRNLIAGGDFWHSAESQIGSDYTEEQTRASEPAPQTVLQQYNTGDHVRHAQFGEGVVVSCTARGSDSELVVAFSGVGVKKLLLSFAKLEKMG